jgi:hypothetical protein
VRAIAASPRYCCAPHGDHCATQLGQRRPGAGEDAGGFADCDPDRDPDEHRDASINCNRDGNRHTYGHSNRYTGPDRHRDRSFDADRYAERNANINKHHDGKPNGNCDAYGVGHLNCHPDQYANEYPHPHTHSDPDQHGD